MASPNSLQKGSFHKGFEIQEVLRHGDGSRPHVLRIRFANSDAVLKDFDGCDKWFARSFGRLLAARESAALAALSEVSGVPDFIERVGSRALLMEFVMAEPAVKVYDDAQSTGDVEESTADIDWSKFIARFDALVNDLHEAGVAHGDLRSPMNTLITSAAEPVIVDFTAAFIRRGLEIPGRGWLFTKLAEIDQSAVTKMALHVDPRSVSDSDRERHHRRGPLDRMARRTGQSVRWLSRLLISR